MDMRLFTAAALLVSFGAPALAQQQGQSQDPQQLQMTLTEQALANATHEFISERTQGLILRNQLSEAQANLAKKDAEIKDLKGQIESAAKSNTAAAHPPSDLPVPRPPDQPK